MRDLNFGLKKLVQQHKDGSYGTRSARQAILQQAANELHDLGYRKLRPESLKPKHVEALIGHWQAKALSPGTIKNRLSHVRWWAQHVGKAAVVARNNAHYGIDNRRHVTGVDKSRELRTQALANIKDPFVTLSLRLQAAFGLRREESIKFSAQYADKGDHLMLKASWTKGGKARMVPIRTEQQRTLLSEVRRVAGRGSLIPSNKNYIQQLRVYERHTQLAGLDRNHGLRHAYAQRRYQELTGWACPVRGGPSPRSLPLEKRQIDHAARDILSKELGHERRGIVAVYIG